MLDGYCAGTLRRRPFVMMVDFSAKLTAATRAPVHSCLRRTAVDVDLSRVCACDGCDAQSASAATSAPAAEPALLFLTSASPSSNDRTVAFGTVPRLNHDRRWRGMEVCVLAGSLCLQRGMRLAGERFLLLARDTSHRAIGHLEPRRCGTRVRAVPKCTA